MSCGTRVATVNYIAVIIRSKNKNIDNLVYEKIKHAAN